MGRRPDTGRHPPDLVERAKHLLLDGLGCGLIGAQLPWSRIATEAVLDLEGRGDTAVIGTGQTTSGPAAAVLNGTFIQGFELDDFHPLAPVHSCSLVIPALLSTATAPERTTRRGLPARGDHRLRGRSARRLHVARRADARPWLALRPGVRHPHGGDGFGQTARTVAGPAGGCARPGRHAVGGSDGRAVRGNEQAHAPGFAARNGFYAAGLAAAGYTGIKRVFEREYGGFLSVFGEGHEPDASLLTGELGERWETSIIMVKSYAAMGGLHGAVDAARRLRASVAPHDISQIDITVGETVYKHGWWVPERPLTPIGAQMNIGYATAAALLDGNVLPEQFTPARLDADDIWSLIGAPMSTRRSR